ncbi:MAG: RNA methyltransferase [Patescibacteria group bacterium]|jgi:TrmH family RNA methyltransferase
MKIISSSNNQLLKDIVKLRKASERKKRGLIIIDGAREIASAAKSGIIIESLFYCSDFVKNGECGDFFGLAEEKIIELTKDGFEKISCKENPDGFLAVAQPRKLLLKDIDLGSTPLLIILEGVEKPGNLGAIIRTAYAAGATAVIVNDSQTDIYNPNVIRASEGLIFMEPVVSASFDETKKWLKTNKIRSFGAATSAKKEYDNVSFIKPTAIVLGSEADGLSEEWLKGSDSLIKIPMKKGIDSLNVSVSAAVIVFEALRQRKS